MSAKAYLVKVMVQPSFVVVDDDGAHEVVGSAAEVPGAAWQTFAVSAFGDDDLREVVAQYEQTITGATTEPS